MRWGVLVIGGAVGGILGAVVAYIDSTRVAVTVCNDEGFQAACAGLGLRLIPTAWYVPIGVVVGLVVGFVVARVMATRAG